MAKTHEMDLCEGSLWKKILIFSIPLMFSNVFKPFPGFVQHVRCGSGRKICMTDCAGRRRLHQHPCHPVYRSVNRTCQRCQCTDCSLYRFQKREGRQGNRTYRRYFMLQCRGFDLCSGHSIYPSGSYSDAHKGGADRRRRSLSAHLSARHARPCRF